MTRELRIPISALAVALGILAGAPAHSDSPDACAPCHECTRAIVESLRSRGWLGLGFHLHDHETGLGVQFVDPDGPAARSGIVRGDRVTKFQGIEIGPLSRDEVLELLRGIHPNDRVALEVAGDEGRRALTLTATQMSARALAGAVGAHYLEGLKEGHPPPEHP